MSSLGTGGGRGRPVAAGTADASPGDAPGGWRAVASGFCALSVTFAVAYSFGAFVVPMSAALGATKSQMGWVFSIASCIFLSLGLVTGPLNDRFGPRYLLLAAGALIGCGLVATARVTSVAQAYATYGVGVGLGMACVFVPIVATVGAAFVRHRAQALGIAVSGVGLGTIAGPPLAAAAIVQYGWRATLMGLGMGAAVALASLALIVPRGPVARVAGRDGWRLRSVLRHREFLLVYVSAITVGLVLYVAVVFLAPYAVHVGIPSVEAASLVSGIGLASAATRVVFGGLADRLGVVRMFKISNALLVLAYLLWLVAGASYSRLLAVAVVLGAGYGAIVALTPAVLIAYFGREHGGAVMGALYTGTAFGALAGTPMAGRIIGPGNAYEAAIWTFLAVGAVGATAVTALRPLPADSE